MEKYSLNYFDDGIQKSLYTPAYSYKSKQFTVGKIALCLFFLPVEISSNTISVELVDTLYDTSIEVPFKTADYDGLSIKLPRSSEFSRESINYQHFLASYNQNAPSEKILTSLMPLFNKLAHGLESIKIDKSFVDISAKKSQIEFSMMLPHEVYVSVLKGLDSIEDETVIFTISVNGNLKAAGCEDLKTIQSKILELQKSIDEMYEVS